MRPIDADVLIPLIQEEKIEGETLNIIKALGEGLQAETLNQACDRHIKIIRGLPTIEPKRGKWIPNSPFTGNCSECGGKGNLKDNYCSTCGVKMDDDWEEPEINPCRGCEDYDGHGGCKSHGGCGAEESEDE